MKPSFVEFTSINNEYLYINTSAISHIIGISDNEKCKIVLKDGTEFPVNESFEEVKDWVGGGS